MHELDRKLSQEYPLGMANRRPGYEKQVKKLGGQVVPAGEDKVNIIYPETWIPNKRKKTK